MEQAIDAEGLLTSAILRQTGLEVFFDNQRLELRIQVPAAQRKPNQLSIRKDQRKLTTNQIPTSQFSGYLNLRGTQTIDWRGNQTKPAGREPLKLALEGAINLRGWVLESDAQLTEGDRWQQGNIRLLHDDTERALRYVIGDIAPPTTGYQSSTAMLGVAVARNFSLQPDRVTRPINQFQFFLERKSRVEVLSNGKSLQVLFLEAGTQDLRDLPLAAGISDVQLVITDDLGQVKRLDFTTATASQLLAPGLQQFAYSLGVPAAASKGRFSYDWQQPTLTLAYRWGASRFLTTGSYLQANARSQLFGWEGYFATPVGIWNWDTAVSHHRDRGTDLAAKLRYDFIKLGENNPSRRAFGFTAEYRGANFTRLAAASGNNATENATDNTTWLDLNAYYKQKLFGTVNANLEGRYQFQRNQPNAYQLSLGLTTNLSQQVGINARFSYKQESNGQTDQRFSVNLNWQQSIGQQSLQSSSSFSSQSATSHRLNWSYNSPNPIHGLKSSLSLNVNEPGIDFSSRLQFPSYRFNAELTHKGFLFAHDRTPKRQETQLTFGSAIVFADGHWAISRPVNNSFAIVVPNQRLKDQMIGINSDGKGGYAAVAKGSAAVFPNLAAYRLSSIQFNAPDLPIGLDLGKSSAEIFPTYKSGAVIKLGNDATVFLRGRLQDQQGNPMGFATGQVISRSDKTWQSVTLFTNQTGRFALLGFKPGKYEIQLNQPQRVRIPFEIPADANGVHQIGILQATINEDS